MTTFPIVISLALLQSAHQLLLVAYGIGVVVVSLIVICSKVGQRAQGLQIVNGATVKTNVSREEIVTIER